MVVRTTWGYRCGPSAPAAAEIGASLRPCRPAGSTGAGGLDGRGKNLHSDRDVAYRLKALPTWSIVSAATLLLVVDPLFLAANLTKLAHGAWLPLLIGISAFTVMTTWQRGRQLITARREAMEGSLLDGTPSQRGAVEGTGLAGRRGFAGSAGDRDEGELGRLDIPRPGTRHACGRKVDGQPHRDGSTLRRAPEIPGLAGPTCARHPPDLRPPVQDTGAMPVGPLPRFPGTAWRGPVGRTRECRAPRRRTAPARSMLSRRNPSKVDPRSAPRSPSWTHEERAREGRLNPQERSPWY